MNSHVCDPIRQSALGVGKVFVTLPFILRSVFPIRDFDTLDLLAASLPVEQQVAAVSHGLLLGRKRPPAQRWSPEQVSVGV